MKYAKPVIKDKFWIVKDDNVNVATIEKRNDDFVVIKDSIKTTYTDENQVSTFFGEDIFANQPKEVKLIKEAHDCLLYTSPSPRDGLLSRMPSSA